MWWYVCVYVIYVNVLLHIVSKKDFPEGTIKYTLSSCGLTCMSQEEESDRLFYDSDIYGKCYVIHHSMTFAQDLSMHTRWLPGNFHMLVK